MSITSKRSTAVRVEGHREQEADRLHRKTQHGGRSEERHQLANRDLADPSEPDAGEQAESERDIRNHQQPEPNARDRLGLLNLESRRSSAWERSSERMLASTGRSLRTRIPCTDSSTAVEVPGLVLAPASHHGVLLFEEITVDPERNRTDHEDDTEDPADRQKEHEPDEDRQGVDDEQHDAEGDPAAHQAEVANGTAQLAARSGRGRTGRS
jgi:hypothetical protein